MPFFRRKSEAKPVRASSISVYGQGRAQVFHNKKTERLSETGSFSSVEFEDRPAPLVFAEATFDPSLPMKTKSRLSKNLLEVLHDNSALAYFIQFMDAQKAKHLVKFWLEAESFQISLETKRKGHSPPESSATSDSTKSKNVFPSSPAVSPPEATVGISDVNSVNRGDSTVAGNGRDCVDDGKSTVVLRTELSLSTDSGCDGNMGASPGQRDVDKTVDDGAGSDDGCCAGERLCDKSEVAGEDCEDNAKEKCIESKQSAVRLVTSIEQDAHSIYNKYISSEASHPIGVSDEIRSQIESNLNESSCAIPSDLFVPAQVFVVKRMEDEYFSNFLRSSFHCKHQIDVLTSGTVFLADVLYNDSALFFFMEFMEQEGVHHFVDFLLMADNFQKHLLAQGQYDGMQAQADAMVIYEKYFSLQATSPLGFSDPVRFEVEANICREGGPLPDCFLKPVKILTQYLEKTYLLQFLNSQLYFKYISECIIIIQTGGAEGDMQQKYAASDSGSEQSLPLSSVNTLLAMERPGSKVIRNLDDQDMRIDLMQFKPDALWKRPMAGKLQMAHVDHLGRVTVDFEPEPDKRKESRISKAVKKLVNWEEDKNQEDMAWKVAEMIVKDICSVTMSDTDEGKGQDTTS